MAPGSCVGSNEVLRPIVRELRFIDKPDERIVTRCSVRRHGLSSVFSEAQLPGEVCSIRPVEIERV
jgi:hypothetical protein